MQTHEIRRRFLDHFVTAGHTEVASASLIFDDPNLEGQVGKDRPELGTGAVRKEVAGIGQSSGHVGTDIRGQRKGVRTVPSGLP